MENGKVKFQKSKTQKLFLLAFLIVIFNLRAVAAQEMNSQNFKIEGGNFNMTSGNKSSQTYKLSDVVGQLAANVFASKGYIIKTGYANSAAGAPFSFSVSPTLVDFGILTPNIPVEKEVRVSISNGNATGYIVKVAANQSLSTSVGAEIPDTVCDTKTSACTKNTATLWKENSSYGFGFKASGKTIANDLKKDNFYRPFAQTKKNEQAELIMESHAQKVVDQATMNLKLVIGPNQPVGQYNNVITFTAMVGI